MKQKGWSYFSLTFQIRLKKRRNQSLLKLKTEKYEGISDCNFQEGWKKIANLVKVSVNTMSISKALVF